MHGSRMDAFVMRTPFGIRSSNTTSSPSSRYTCLAVICTMYRRLQKGQTCARTCVCVCVCVCVNEKRAEHRQAGRHTDTQTQTHTHRW